LTDFDEICFADAYLLFRHYGENKLLKCKIVDGRHLEKSKKKSRYPRNGFTDFDEIWHDDAPWPCGPYHRIKFRCFKMAIVLKMKIVI